MIVIHAHPFHRHSTLSPYRIPTINVVGVPDPLKKEMREMYGDVDDVPHTFAEQRVC